MNLVMLYDLWVRLDSIRQKVRTAFIVSELKLIVVNFLLSVLYFVNSCAHPHLHTNWNAANWTPGVTGKLGRQWTS